MKKKSKYTKGDWVLYFTLFLELLNVFQILFAALKVAGVITLTWAVVLIPLWIDIGIAFILLLGFAIYLIHER